MKKIFFILLFFPMLTFSQQKKIVVDDASDNKKILGIWTYSDSDNAVFVIKKNTIYYVDNSKSYKYSYINNILKIFYEEGDTYIAKVTFNKDTMILNSKQYGISKYWKFKN